MAETSNEIISRLANELRMPARALNSTGLRSFRNLDVSAFTERDQRRIRNIVKRHVRRAMSERGIAEAAVTAETLEAINEALAGARGELLSDETKITLKAKDFIRDHCPC